MSCAQRTKVQNSATKTWTVSNLRGGGGRGRLLALPFFLVLERVCVCQYSTKTRLTVRVWPSPLSPSGPTCPPAYPSASCQPSLPQLPSPPACPPPSASSFWPFFGPGLHQTPKVFFPLHDRYTICTPHSMKTTDCVYVLLTPHS